MKNESFPRAIVIAAWVIVIAGVAYITRMIYEPVVSPFFDILPPFIIAFILSFLLDPLVDALQKLKLSRGVSVLVVGLGFVGVFVLAGILLVPRLIDQASGLAANFSTYVREAQGQLNGLLISLSPILKRFHLPTTTAEWTTQYANQINSAGAAAFGMLANTLSSIASRAMWVIIIPMSTFFLLIDLDYIKAKIVHLTPDKHQSRLKSISSEVGSVFGKYVRGMMLVAMLYSVVTSILFTLFGLPYALILGAVAGLFYLVPYLGSVIIIGMAVVSVLVQPGGSASTAGVLAVILLIENSIIFDLIITPRIAGGSVGVHPVLALFSLTLGARMFGVVGMVFAVPVMASLQVIARQLYPKISDDLRVKTPKRTRSRNRAG